MNIIGIDVGGMSIKGGICDENGNIRYSYSVKTKTYDKSYSISEDIASVIDGLLKLSCLKITDIAGVGIGHPGVVDSTNGVIKYSNNIALENVPLIAELKQRFNAEYYINNDANCAVLGEMIFGSAKGYNDVILITLGTGVGSGIVIDGKLFEGRESGGAEAGHMVIVSHGNKCNCGRYGCYETYASASALIRQTKKAMENAPDSLMHRIAEESGQVDGKTAFTAAKLNDDAAMQVVETYVGYISEGLINLANIFRPEVIIIGGGISKEGNFLIDKLAGDMSWQTFGGRHNPQVEVRAAQLFNNAGILGAVALVLNKKTTSRNSI